MRLRPVPVKVALRFNLKTHRRLPRLQGGMWAVAIERRAILGVAIVGRPTARRLDNGRRLQVLRCAVREGVPNGCSMLYGAVARSAKAMGATDCFTYTHADETGISLKASGWIEDTEFHSKGGAEWGSRPNRRTVDPNPKRRFFAPWSEMIQRRVSLTTGNRPLVTAL
jgi:hypothetical protein